MKTPREVLWQRHRSVEPKLDAVREKALANLTPARTLLPEPAGERERLLTPALSSTEEEREKSAAQSMAQEENALLHADARRVTRSTAERDPGRGIREMLLNFRWHLAGMSAAWVLVALLNIDPSPSPVAAMAKERIPSPQELLAALRENRRQIAELLDSPASVSEPAPAPPSFVPKRRGEIQSASATA